MSLEKAKLLTMGKQLTSNEDLPMKLEEGEIAMVGDLTYFGSNTVKDGEVQSKLSTRIGKTSRTFGGLQSAIFRNWRLRVSLK